MTTTAEEMKKFIDDKFGSLDRKLNTIVEEKESASTQDLQPLTIQQFVCFLQFFGILENFFLGFFLYLL